jgi:CBS domain-containing protein
MGDAAHLMYRARIRRLPVVSDSSKIFDGMLTNKDLLRLLSRISADPQKRADNGFETKVSEIMTREIISVDSDDDIRVAASRMMIFGVGGLTVVDPSGRVVGLITERDLVKRLAERKSIEFLVRAMKFELELIGRAP